MRHAEGQNNKCIEGNPQNGVHASAHAIFDEFALERAHGRVVNPAAHLKDAETPEHNVLLADVCRQEEAERRGSKGIDEDLLGCQGRRGGGQVVVYH